MLLTIFSNYVILLSIFGFSYILKRALIHKPNLSIENIDFFYGFLAIIFLSLFINFFFPLKFFTIPIIIIGFVSYLIGFKKKIYKVNFSFYFLIIFLITFISYYGNDNVDSPMYHLQIIKWMSLHKINFGISNLEIRLGNNSSWHSFIALLNLSYLNFSIKYYLSAIFLSFIVYEGLHFKKTIKFSNIFLYLVICYLFLYSYLHPFAYGVILNHIGNPERDIASMLLYFSVIYLFFKIFEENDNFDYQTNLINIFIISAFICVTTRVTTIPILFLVFYIFYKYRNYKIFNFGNIFIMIVGLLWMLRSFVLSGCLIFPIKQSCVATSWSANIDTVQFYVTEAMRYTRTLPSLNRVDDLNYTLYSFDWLLPWFKNYFLSAAIFQINSLIIFVIILFFIFKYFFFNKTKNLFLKVDQFEIIIFSVLVFHFLFWMQAPEIRYAWGMHLVIPCFFIIIFLKNNFKDMVQKLNHKFLLITFSAIFLLFFSKSLSFFSIQDLLLTPNRKLDFSLIIKIGTFNSVDIYSNNWKCADFEGVCVNTPKSNYDINKKYSYTFFN